jgi:hypothetical protein
MTLRPPAMDKLVDFQEVTQQLADHRHRTVVMAITTSVKPASLSMNTDGALTCRSRSELGSYYLLSHSKLKRTQLSCSSYPTPPLYDGPNQRNLLKQTGRSAIGIGAENAPHV